MLKMAKLPIPDQSYSWTKDSFHRRSHCTKLAGNISELADILAGIIQGSAIGPAAYLVTAADLRPMHDTNEILKFADDTYLVKEVKKTKLFPSRAVTEEKQFSFRHRNKVSSEGIMLLGNKKQVCIQLPTSADNVTLLAVPAVQQAIDISCPLGPTATNSPNSAAVVDRWYRQTDRQTDTVPLHRPCRVLCDQCRQRTTR